MVGKMKGDLKALRESDDESSEEEELVFFFFVFLLFNSHKLSFEFQNCGGKGIGRRLVQRIQRARRK